MNPKSRLQRRAVEQPTTGGRFTRLKRWTSILTVALLAVSGALVATSSATADAMTGTVSGEFLVQSEDGSYAIPDAFDMQVTAWRLIEADEPGEPPTAVNEGGAFAPLNDGIWTLGSLPTGFYAFQYTYVGPIHGVVSGFSDGSISINEQLDRLESFVAIGEGESRFFSGSLRQGAKVSGTVGTTAAPLAGQPVHIWRLTTGADGDDYWADFHSMTTDSSGHYAADTLPPGTYAWQAGGAGGYVREFYEDVYSNEPDDANTDDLEFGSDVIRDFTLAKGSEISGSVKSSSGTGLGGILVSAYEFDGGPGDIVTTTMTTSSGAYKLPAVPAGAYAISFESPDLTAKPYLSEFWNDKSFYNATSLTVSGTTARTGINAVLTKAAKITGTLSLEVGGFPLADDIGIEACAFFPGDDYAECGEDLGYTYDEGTGAYSLLGLKAGSYTVFVEYVGSGIYRDEYFSDARDDSTATRFAVATGATVAGKNIMLDAGASIQGVVEDVLGAPVDGAGIEIYPAVGNHAEDDLIASTETDENGYYSLFGLEPGSVAVHVTPPNGSGLADQWYLGSASPSHITPVELELWTMSDASFALETAQGISGTVRTAAENEPLPYAWVGVHRFRSPTSMATEYVGGTTADAFGHYEFNGLAPGDYVLRVEAQNLGYVLAWDGAQWDEAIQNAERIHLGSAHGEVRDINVRRGATVTGRVISADGPLPDVWVGLRCSDNDQQDHRQVDDGSGVFTFEGLEPGDCSLRIEPGMGGLVVNTQVALPELKLDWETIDLGDILIASASVIEGRVLGTDGKPVAAVGIIPYIQDEHGLPVQTGDYAETDAQGRYALEALPVGKIYLQFLQGKYPMQYLGGSPDWSQSEFVEMPSAGAVVHRDVRLIDGGRITGKITNSATGVGVRNILVQAIPLTSDGTGPSFGGSAMTSSTGTYTISGLPYGSYEVVVNQDYGVLSTWQGYTHTNQTVYLPARTTKTVNAKVTPTLRVGGTVRDETGHTLDDIRVEAFKVVNGSPVFGASNGPVSSTNGAGVYDLRLEPGSWVIRFSDWNGLVADTYYGNVHDQDDATRVVLSKASVNGKNVTMPKLGGGITGNFFGEHETPSGYVTLSRLDDEGDVLWSKSLSDDQLDDVNDVFPIENLAPGSYRLRVEAWGGIGHFGVTYAPRVLNDIEVVADSMTNLGNVLIEGFQEISPSGFPMVVPPNAPTIGYCDLEVGSTLWAIAGEWNQIPTQTDYQWLRDGQPIPGADEETYRLTPGDAGHHIRLATGIQSRAYPYANPYAYITDETPEVTPGDAPVPTTGPSISGQTSVGQTLKAVPGTWSIPGVEFSYRWIRTANSVADTVVSTASSYKVAAADLWAVDTNVRLHLEVTAKRTGYENGVASAHAPTVVPASGPKVLIKGKVTVTAPGVYKVTAGSWSPTGVSYRYLWITRYPDGSNSVFEDDEHGSSATHTDGGSELLEVKILASKAGYYSTSYTLTVRTGPKIVIDGAAQLSATPQLGLPVSVDLSGLTFSVDGPTLSYQWYRNGAAIAGAKAASYTPSATDVAKTLSVKVVASATGYPSSLPSTAVAVAPTLAAGTITPGMVWVSGPATIGRTLTAEAGTWSPAPTSWSYQWKRDGVAITGATAKSYLVGSKDLGKFLTVTVTGKRAGFANVSVDSVALPEVIDWPIWNLVRPAINPVIRVGQTVTTTTGKWDLSPTSFGYQWKINGVSIPGATASSYIATPSDVGQELCVEVTAKRTGFQSSPGVCSNGVIVDKGAAVSATAKPVLKVNGVTVTKTLLGKIVTASSGTWPVSGLVFSYQWQVLDGSDWLNIDGATHDLLVLDGSIEPFHVGSSYRVVVTAGRGGYLPSPSIASAPVLVTG